MADSSGQTPNHLISRLAAQPHAYGFYAAVRLLQAAAPNHPRIGTSESPARDPVRFAQSPALDFAPSTLEAVQQRHPGRPPTLYSRHFGLFGPNGPLPLCLTEYAHGRILHHGDATFAAFCNVFHHRLLSFFFRAWAEANKSVDYDRPDDSAWSYYVGSLIGLGLESLLDREEVPDRAKFYFAGHLARQSRNPEGLESILQEFFGVPTQLETFVGKWIDLPTESICRIGRTRATGLLGSSVIAGSRFWTRQLHFRIRMGAMNYHDYERLLPSGASFARLRDWVRLYVGEHYSWDLQLLLAREEVPSAQLGKSGRLGWTTWLKTQPLKRDADDLVLVPPGQSPQQPSQKLHETTC
jgi:type VI secretion system protein ImpH